MTQPSRGSARGTFVINWPVWNMVKAAHADRLIRTTAEEVRIVARRGAMMHRYPRRFHFPISLADSIYVDVRRLGSTWRARIGSNLPYAASVENGARRHPIAARRRASGGMLVFFWRREGRLVVTPEVLHPGQQGKHYLRDALDFAARRRGFTVYHR